MTVAKQDVIIQQSQVQGQKAKMSYTLNTGTTAQAEMAVVKFILKEKPQRNNVVRDSLVRGIDLIRAMGVVQGFKSSIESTIKSMQIDVSTLGFEFYQSMKTCTLKVLDPSGAIQKMAMKYMDQKIREKTENPADLSFVYQFLVKSLKLKNSDPEGFIEDMKFAYVEDVIASDRIGGNLKVS